MVSDSPSAFNADCLATEIASGVEKTSDIDVDGEGGGGSLAVLRRAGMHVLVINFFV
jgi:hypothetical protein